MDSELKKMLQENVTVTVVVAGQAFGLSRVTAYQAVKNGDIPSIKIGGRICVPTAPLRRMLGIDVEAA